MADYRGDYDAYLYYVNKEIDEGERDQQAKASPGKPANPTRAPRKEKGGHERDLRKESASLKRQIAKLDDRKHNLGAQLHESTDPAEALRLHEEVMAIVAQLTPIEERWCELQTLLEDADA